MKKLEIYTGRDKIFEKEIKALKEAKISQRNKELITGFQNYLFAKPSGELRVSKLSYQLRTLCRWAENQGITKDLSEFDKKDVENLVSFVNRLKEFSEATKADYRRTLKQFFMWFKEDDSRVYSKQDDKRIQAKKLYTYLEKEVSGTYKREQADPNTIITDEEIKLVAEKGGATPKEKAFLMLLHETGCRAGEFLNLKIGSIVIRENHADIFVPDGKTGKRTAYSTPNHSLSYLLRYLDIHPYKDNKNAFLWLSDARFNQKQPLLHMGGQKLIDRCFERAGVLKKHNWHWFRHSRATTLAPKMTEVMLCKYMGWSMGSRQVKNYVHLCTKQLEDVYLKINGLMSKEEEQQQPIKCICDALNNPKDRYCYKCHKPLRVETLIQDKELIDSETNKTIQFLMDMMKNPEMMKAFEEFKKKSS